MPVSEYFFCSRRNCSTLIVPFRISASIWISDYLLEKRIDATRIDRGRKLSGRECKSAKILPLMHCSPWLVWVFINNLHNKRFTCEMRQCLLGIHELEQIYEHAKLQLNIASTNSCIVSMRWIVFPLSLSKCVQWMPAPRWRIALICRNALPVWSALECFLQVCYSHMCRTFTQKTMNTQVLSFLHIHNKNLW